MDDFCLPVPEMSIKNDKQNFLPGAPASLENGRGFHLIPNTSTLLKEYEESKLFAQTRIVFERLDDYFNQNENGHKVRSILSIALTDHKGRNEKGVINIHSNFVGMFQHTQHLESFIRIITPIRQKIYLLLPDEI